MKCARVAEFGKGHRDCLSFVIQKLSPNRVQGNTSLAIVEEGNGTQEVGDNNPQALV